MYLIFLLNDLNELSTVEHYKDKKCSININTY